MLIIPDKLISQDISRVFYASPDAVLMRKRLLNSLEGRESYLSMHAFSFVMKGKQLIRTYEGEKLDIQQNQLGCFRKGLYTINDLISPGEGFESYLLFLSDDYLSKLASEMSWKPDKKRILIPNLHILAQPSYTRIFWEGMEVLDEEGQLSWEIIQLKIRELLAVLSAKEGSFADILHSLGTAAPKSLKAFMEANFDKPLTIEDYAFLTGRSESTFRREFKSKFAITPRKWIIQKRMEKAKDLLQKTQFEVGRVAIEVGYENTSHFIVEFKKHFGSTPSQIGQQGRMAM
ncbi:MAG: AraC family transcriptional regulator [Bacteroidota bacterium]